MLTVCISIAPTRGCGFQLPTQRIHDAPADLSQKTSGRDDSDKPGRPSSVVTGNELNKCVVANKLVVMEGAA